MEGRQVGGNEAGWKKDQIIQIYWNSLYYWAASVVLALGDASEPPCELTGSAHGWQMDEAVRNTGKTPLTSLPVRSLAACTHRLLFKCVHVLVKYKQLR